MDFSSSELIENAIAAINADLYVSQLQYTVSVASQREHITNEQMQGSDAFGVVKTKTNILQHSEVSQVKYDLVGKIAEGTVLTRRTTAAILKGITRSMQISYVQQASKMKCAIKES